MYAQAQPVGTAHAQHTHTHTQAQTAFLPPSVASSRPSIVTGPKSPTPKPDSQLRRGEVKNDVTGQQ